MTDDENESERVAGRALAALAVRMMKERDALLWQIEHEGCAVSHIGETTYECRADSPCGLCRLRGQRDRLRAENEALIDDLKHLRSILDEFRETRKTP